MRRLRLVLVVIGLVLAGTSVPASADTRSVVDTAPDAGILALYDITGVTWDYGDERLVVTADITGVRRKGVVLSARSAHDWEGYEVEARTWWEDGRKIDRLWIAYNTISRVWTDCPGLTSRWRRGDGGSSGSAFRTAACSTATRCVTSARRPTGSAIRDKVRTGSRRRRAHLGLGTLLSASDASRSSCLRAITRSPSASAGASQGRVRATTLSSSRVRSPTGTTTYDMWAPMIVAVRCSPASTATIRPWSRPNARVNGPPTGVGQVPPFGGGATAKVVDEVIGVRREAHLPQACPDGRGVGVDRDAAPRLQGRCRDEVVARVVPEHVVVTHAPAVSDHAWILAPRRNDVPRAGDCRASPDGNTFA